MLTSKERNAAKKLEWKRANKELHVFHNMKSTYKIKYGMTVEQVAEFKAVRQNKCDICGNERKKMCIDHDHKTNTVRGLLCHECNTALGLVHDDVEVLKKAITYLGVTYS